jgi:hypothetical protein
MTTLRAHCTLDRAETAPEAGMLPVFHTVPPKGVYPSKIILPDGKHKSGRLIIDDLAYERILANFQAAATAPDFPGLLVDREHLSEQPDGDSTAAAWAKTIARREDGLWTGWELTALGETLIPTRNFKFRSPVFDLERIEGKTDEYRPVRLVSIALTNVPHFKTLAPSLNREDASTQTGGPAMLEMLRKKFNKPEATEEELLALLTGALNEGESATAECSALRQKVQAFETEKLNAAADAFVAEHGSKVSDTAKLRARYIADPAGTLETVGLIKLPEAAPAPRALGRDQAERTPAPDGKQKERDEALNQAQSKHRCTRARAWEIVQQENPELFK